MNLQKIGFCIALLFCLIVVGYVMKDNTPEQEQYKEIEEKQVNDLIGKPLSE